MSNRFVCSSCGAPHIIEIRPLQTSRARIGTPSRKYQMAVWLRGEDGEFVRQENPYGESSADDDLIELKSPARSPTVESDVKVPFSQAAITGMLWGAASSSLWALLGLEKPILFWAGSSLIITSVSWSSGVNTMRKLMWRIEKFANRDFDKDNHIGKPPPEQPRNRTVIERQGSAPRLPESWEQLDAERQVADVHRFAEIVWSRQEAGLGTGQKALRGTALPSGFEMNDDIHGWMLADLDDAGVIRRNGSNWRLEARPPVVKKLIRVEQW